jgi:hypothetical protein
MTDFDWVTERHRCSPLAVFESLKIELQSDVKARNAVRGEDRYYGFESTVVQGDSIVVIRNGNNISDSVTFSLEDGKIVVYDRKRTPLLEATLTLNNKGECRLKIKGEECELWHLRKMALEELFFGKF